RLPEEMPSKSRFFVPLVDEAFFAFWTVPTGDGVDLHGGRLTFRTDNGAAAVSLSPKDMLPHVSLGTASQGVSPESDIAVAPVENSLVAVIVKRDETLATVAFTDRGVVFAGPGPLEMRSPRSDLRIGQPVSIIILTLVFILSLWQWRQKPMA